MPGIGYDEAAEARRKAEEAAARAKRIKEIENKIDQLKKEREPVIKQIDDLEKERLKLLSYQKMWEEKKSKYNGNDILSEVVIVNIFEGVCADKIKNDFTVCMKEMDRTYSKAGGFGENIGAQINRLNQYVNDINADIKSLRAELAFII